MEAIKKIQVSDDSYIEIFYDESYDSPREWSNETDLCIREHRRYSFPNELDFCFDCLDDDTVYSSDDDGSNEITVGENELKKLEQYHIFPLDCYEHSGISFSLRGEGMQCAFDTSGNVGFIAVDKSKYDYDKALELARQELDIYNKYLNGEVYGFRYMQTFPPKEIGGRIYHTDDEEIDSCWGFYDMKDMAEHLPEDVREIFLNHI